jgi:hypothetical protein
MPPMTQFSPPPLRLQVLAFPDWLKPKSVAHVSPLQSVFAPEHSAVDALALMRSVLPAVSVATVPTQRLRASVGHGSEAFRSPSLSSSPTTALALAPRPSDDD